MMEEEEDDLVVEEKKGNDVIKEMHQMLVEMECWKEIMVSLTLAILRH